MESTESTQRLQRLLDNLVEAVAAETRAYEWEDVPIAREAVEGKVAAARQAILDHVADLQCGQIEKKE